MKNLIPSLWDIVPTNTTVYVVFNGISSGCYHLYSDAEEAAWDSNVPVGMFKTKRSARYALTKFKNKKSKLS